MVEIIFDCVNADYANAINESLTTATITGTSTIDGTKVTIKLDAPNKTYQIKTLANTAVIKSMTVRYIIAPTISPANFTTFRGSLDVNIEAVEGLKALQIVRKSARLIQGGGGGQPYFAQAGGKDASKLKDALDKMHEMVVA